MWVAKNQQICKHFCWQKHINSFPEGQLINYWTNRCISKWNHKSYWDILSFQSHTFYRVMQVYLICSGSLHQIWNNSIFPLKFKVCGFISVCACLTDVNSSDGDTDPSQTLKCVTSPFFQWGAEAGLPEVSASWGGTDLSKNVYYYYINHFIIILLYRSGFVKSETVIWLIGFGITRIYVLLWVNS